MTAVLFVGPTLARADLERFEGFDIRPPVAQGDVYAVALTSPAAIGIIDGYFHGVPAVWHKEILWAMDEGIHVFGAASMGALRAAELHVFGMRGIGRIFEDYRDGVLTDDDEVAVQHGPAEAGFVTVTEPMVNIRATMARAVEESVISDDQRRHVLDLSKAQYYQERTWDSVLTALGVAAADLPVAELRDWLREGRVDQKRDDALALIRAMAEFLGDDPDPMSAEYEFEVTEMWANAPWNSSAPDDASHSDTEAGEGAGVLDELRLEGSPWFEMQKRALDQAIACGEIDPQAATVERDAAMAELNAFRKQHGLNRRSDIEAWVEREGTDIAGLERMMTERARRRQTARANAAGLNGRILELFRRSGDLARLVRRARHKSEVMAGKGQSGEMPASLRMSDRLLLEWYFHKRLGHEVPDSLDDYAADLGLAGRDSFFALLRDEAIYLNMLAKGDDG